MSEHDDTRLSPRTRRAASGQRLLTRRQIEAEYGLPARTVYDLHCRGLLAAVRVNKNLWFRRADLDALLERSIEVRG